VDERKEAASRISSRPPGYLECSRALERLSRFQDLARHHQRWAHQLKFARPIEALLARGTPENDRPEMLKREILRLIPLVSLDLRRAKVSSAFRMTTEEPGYDFEKQRPVPKETTRTYDVVGDYFLIPYHDGRAQFFDLLMASLEQGIGSYLEAQRSARLRKFNPLYWLAFVIQFPILVLEAAGLQSEEAHSAVLNIYGWTVRLVIVIILALAAAKLGVSIPWRELGSLFR